MKSEQKTQPKLIGCVAQWIVFSGITLREGLRTATDKLEAKNFYVFNPSFDKHCNKR